MTMTPLAEMFIIINLDRNLSGQSQADNTGSHIFFGPSVAGGTVTCVQRFKYRRISDDMKDVSFPVSDIYRKPGTSNKLIKLFNLVPGDGEKIFV